jgi:hypothetical protein
MAHLAAKLSFLFFGRHFGFCRHLAILIYNFKGLKCSLGQYSTNYIQKYFKVCSIGGVSVDFSVKIYFFGAILIFDHHFRFLGP